MAMTETAPQPLDRAGDRPGRRRPFSMFMKKLAGLKGVSSDDKNRTATSKRSSPKKRQSKNNNPYPQSGHIGLGAPAEESHYSISTARSRSGRSSSAASPERRHSVRLSADGQAPPTAGGRSMAPTVSTDQDISRSITSPSHGASSLAGTSRTANGGLESRRGEDSTFSSPAPSVRSLTTTLTTIQSMAPNGTAAHHTSTANSHNNHHPHQTNNSSQIIHFDQPFPTTSPASAIPVHLTPQGSATGHPTTYATATANNLLTDNASILTLASSSKRRRRRSFDTDASVRALAPSSLFGGSRESLPLSILSANMDGAGGVIVGGGPATPGLHRGASGIANERTSIYSATGILTAAERNSFYANKQQTSIIGGDGASVRSGLFGHGHGDNTANGMPATPALTSPREVVEQEREGARDENRRGSGNSR
ncbi:hypothetical protein B0T19DRAFT_243101 [Cercophora scortea]|uniref:Uncharacterized protein n=1 Tax=Cercophora scortea TaxID=314031 RepID=A0AAE0I8I4_9PEZI|nr:hypothetical protein B0T19DRAFT_243101 [Cercophora scortea]